jgi:hypothetical protein
MKKRDNQETPCERASLVLLGAQLGEAWWRDFLRIF